MISGIRVLSCKKASRVGFYGSLQKLVMLICQIGQLSYDQNLFNGRFFCYLSRTMMFHLWLDSVGWYQ